MSKGYIFEFKHKREKKYGTLSGTRSPYIVGTRREAIFLKGYSRNLLKKEYGKGAKKIKINLKRI